MLTKSTAQYAMNRRPGSHAVSWHGAEKHGVSAKYKDHLMSDKNAFGFGAFVPGFDFLQGLVQAASKGAVGSVPAAPDWSKWVAPTLQPEEIEKRVGELKTVQFWLEQNARALAATIQALEVQKMTLATLRGMNVPVQDLASAFGFGKAPAAAAAAGGAGPYDDMYTRRASEPAAPAPAPEPVAQPEPAPSASTASASTASASTPAPPPAVDPLQWWSALTGQFQQIAAGAMQEAAEQARRNPDLQKAARDAFDAAGRMAAEVAAAATTASRKSAAGASKRGAAAASRPPVARKAAAKAKPAAAKKSAARPAAKKSPARKSPR
ncbi:PhaM family polyhydroxyalkanoate granule multifunctional regulatory protein [Xylophilus sp. GOD-11R]|uniref:PhaM family polyhydroxyalkanoate granule multifunctional regulatory protein n=1 Tax=Xylophilus sp. GOD-11R TaxID=3089814 RepID=UPI00298BFCA8|nr:PhaM family polyhydroxyalkanoate granule multifunctional regulatory protein [Xylophilus sp. GOD-11R]WPB56729.1 hypothetical protein R9X41_21735 [Xylophilus sp. GOD-11R]